MAVRRRFNADRIGLNEAEETYLSFLAGITTGGFWADYGLLGSKC